MVKISKETKRLRKTCLEAAEALRSYARGETVQTNHGELFSPEWVNACRNFLKRANAEGGLSKTEGT